MSINLAELLKGKSTIIKGVSYLTTEKYITPFVDYFEDKNYYFKCYTKQADQISVSDGDPDLVYNRVLIMAIENTDDKVFKKAICMAYGLDVKVPVCKFYMGAINNQDQFLIVDNNLLSLQKIEENVDIDYSIVKTFIEKDISKDIEFELNVLCNSFYSAADNVERLGKWIDFTLKVTLSNDYGKVKISNTLPIEAYNKLFIDKDSEFYVNQKSFSKIYLFNVFTSLLKIDKDILNKFEKNYLIKNMLK